MMSHSHIAEGMKHRVNKTIIKLQLVYHHRLLVAGSVADDDALILRLRPVVGGGHFVIIIFLRRLVALLIIVIIRRLRGRVLGGHRGGQVGALRLEAVGVGHVDHLVDNTVGTGVAELTVDVIALLVTVSLHRLAGLGGVDAVLRLETGNEKDVKFSLCYEDVGKLFLGTYG